MYLYVGSCTEDAVPNFFSRFHPTCTSGLSFSISAPTKPISMYDSRFIDDSVVDVIVPQHSDYEVEDIIASTSSLEPEEFRVFPQIPQRGLLYFGKLRGDMLVNLRPYSFTGT